jgi:hypothetical protein
MSPSGETASVLGLVWDEALEQTNATAIATPSSFLIALLIHGESDAGRASG